MGMKSNSNHFKGTNGARKTAFLSLDIQLFAKMPENESQIKHIMRDDKGHLEDTYNNRESLIKLTEDEKNYLGTDSYGKKWYAKQIGDSQLWASVFNGIISDGGINKRPLVFIPGRGLKVNSLLRRKNK